MKKKLKPLKRPAKLGFFSYLGDTQGCGTIRVIQPYLLLNHFRQKDLMIHAQYGINYVPDPNWYQVFTFVQFQRSATKGHFEIIKHFKNTVQQKFPIPTIYEIDDMLFNIPKWNYASIYYNKNEDLIKRMMSSCDAMITSTAKLKEVYSNYNKKIAVIQNHLPKFIWGDVYPKHNYFDESKKIKILWGGSQNHFAMKEIVGNDIKGGDFGNELINFIRKTTDKYEWIFVGAMPEEIKSIKNKIRFVPWVNVFEYPHTIKNLEPDICIAPLMDAEFNECKSNIKALETNAVGAVGIYSDIRPYKFMNCKAKTDEEFIYHIERLANDINLRAKVFNKDFKRISPQLFWEESGNIRKYIETYLGLFGQKL